VKLSPELVLHEVLRVVREKASELRQMGETARDVPSDPSWSISVREIDARIDELMARTARIDHPVCAVPRACSSREQRPSSAVRRADRPRSGVN